MILIRKQAAEKKSRRWVTIIKVAGKKTEGKNSRKYILVSDDGCIWAI